MKSVFDSYPEVILVDATYKLNNLRMPLYLMMCIDGNGQDEIVLMFLTMMEIEEAITKMVQTFKCTNPKWECTKVVMSDKDFNKKAVFKKDFPTHLLVSCPEKLQKRSMEFASRLLHVTRKSVSPLEKETRIGWKTSMGK